MRTMAAMLAAAAAVAAAGCDGDGGGAATRPAGGAVRVPKTLEVVDSLFRDSPGRSAGERLRRKLGDAEAARAVLVVVGGRGEPVRTLVSGFTWTPDRPSVSGRFRLLIPEQTAATVTLKVGEAELWAHSADRDAGVLSPWIEMPADASGVGPVRITVAPTGPYGTGGVTDVLICRAAEGAATAPAP